MSLPVLLQVLKAIVERHAVLFQERVDLEARLKT
jgi:hypothetical protein